MPHQILLVTPDQQARADIAQMLVDAGYDVRRVATFEAATAAFSADAPDLLITALRLGEYNGCHLVLRARSRVPNVRSLLVGIRDDYTHDVQELGIPMIYEPVNERTLLPTVSECLRGLDLGQESLQRRWPRKQAEVPVRVPTGQARVLNVCYRGVGLELAGTTPVVGRPLDLEFSSLGIAVTAVPRWSHEQGQGVIAGCELPQLPDDAEVRWRALVDSIN